MQECKIIIQHLILVYEVKRTNLYVFYFQYEIMYFESVDYTLLIQETNHEPRVLHYLLLETAFRYMFEESCLESAFTNEPAWRMRERIIAQRYVRQRSSNTGLTGLGYRLREVSTYERRDSSSFSFAPLCPFSFS